MARIYFLTLPFPSHVTVSCTLARAVEAFGHECAVVGLEEIGAQVAALGIAHIPIGADRVPNGFLDSFYGTVAGQTRIHSVLTVNREQRVLREMNLECLPELLERDDPDLLVVDQAMFEIAAVVRHTRTPYVVYGAGLQCGRDEGRLPPTFTFNPPGLDLESVSRNLAAYREMDERAYEDVVAPVDRKCREWGVEELGSRSVDRAFRDKLLEIQPIVAEFDLPHRLDITYTGPWLRGADPETSTRFKRNRPLVYASLGTMVNRHERVFRCIAEACADLGLDLVLGLGGGLRADQLGELPGTPTVLEFAPQRRILSEADVFVTHGGLNSVMESLAAGVPMICIPISNEQPGIAVRVAHSGVGDFIRPERLTRPRLREKLRQCLTQPDYARNAARMAERIAASGGVELAARRIDDVVRELTDGPSPKRLARVRSDRGRSDAMRMGEQ